MLSILLDCLLDGIWRSKWTRAKLIGVDAGLMRNHHRLGDRVPFTHKDQFFLVIYSAFVLVKVDCAASGAEFSAETRDEWARPGMVYASVILLDSHGMSRLQVCVDLMVWLLGSVMVIGLVVHFRFATGAPSTKKCPIAPESELPILLLFVGGLGKYIVGTRKGLQLMLMDNCTPCSFLPA